VLGQRRLLGGPAAEGGDSGGHHERMGARRSARAGRLRARRHGRAAATARSAQPVDAVRVVLEGQCGQLGVGLARHLQQEPAGGGAGAEGRAARCVDEGAHRRGHEQPGALADRLGVARSAGVTGRAARRPSAPAGAIATVTGAA
jgi:hypothetical protein